MEKTYGIIDIGSNSVRLLISNGVFLVKNKDVITTQLASGLAKTGELSLEKITETISAVCTLFSKAKNAGATEIFIFATEAVRAAKNGHIFKEKLETAVNAPLHVIDGVLEAQIGFMGANTNPSTTATVIDIGGASIEFVSGSGANISAKKSVPFGMVILKDSLKKSSTEIEKFFKEKLVNVDMFKECESLIFIGGTPTTIASMLMKQETYNAEKIHGYYVSKAALNSLADEIKNMTDLEITSVFKTVSIKRAAIIYYGIITAASILSALNKDGFVVSELDNLEGYLMYKLGINC